MKIGCSAVARPVLFFGHELQEDPSFEQFQADIPGGSVRVYFDRVLWHAVYNASREQSATGIILDTDPHAALRHLENAVREVFANLTSTIAGPGK